MISSLLNCLCNQKELSPSMAAPFFGVICPGDMADQGVACEAFVAQIFTEKMLWQNLKEFFKLCIGKIAEKQALGDKAYIHLVLSKIGGACCASPSSCEDEYLYGLD